MIFWGWFVVAATIHHMSRVIRRVINNSKIKIMLTEKRKKAYELSHSIQILKINRSMIEIHINYYY